jgi:uncharacterized protein (DUF488 family)
MEKLIWTVGTSNRSGEEFLHLLRTYEIEMVADVRSFPFSKVPSFRREVLTESLGEAGVGYAHLGGELGGYREGGYEVYTQTYDYLKGVERLERLSSRCRCVVLCAERFPWKCHRRFIGKSLQERGWKVVHIIAENRIWEAASGEEEENRGK